MSLKIWKKFAGTKVYKLKFLLGFLVDSYNGIQISEGT